MKKLFFTAIALVAFSGVSMANIAEKETKLVKVLVSGVCDEIAYDTYWVWYSRGFGDEFSRAKANAAKAECLKVKAPISG